MELLEKRERAADCTVSSIPKCRTYSLLNFFFYFVNVVAPNMEVISSVRPSFLLRTAPCLADSGNCARLESLSRR